MLYLSFREYLTRWDELAKIFARDAILKGSFDKFAESNKAKRGTAAVDDAFLDEIEQWQADLARNLAIRNPELTQRQLNFSVQRTIDRVVFLRICEDRRIEIYGRLRALLNGEHTMTGSSSCSAKPMSATTQASFISAKKKIESNRRTI